MLDQPLDYRRTIMLTTLPQGVLISKYKSKSVLFLIKVLKIMFWIDKIMQRLIHQRSHYFPDYQKRFTVNVRRLRFYSLRLPETLPVFIALSKACTNEYNICETFKLRIKKKIMLQLYGFLTNDAYNCYMYYSRMCNR